MNTLSFEAYWPLVFFLALPILWRLAARTRTTLSPRHIRFAAVLRSLALALAVLALMRPLWHEGRNDIAVVYALDVSRSVAPGFVEQALKWVRATNQQGKPAQARYVVFADQAKLLNRMEDIGKVAVMPAGEPTGFANAINQGATDVEHALDVAGSGFAANHAKRLVLLSDGNATHGDAWRSLNALKSQGVRVFTIAAAVSTDVDAWVESVTAPQGARLSEPLDVVVRVFARTAARAEVELAMSANGTSDPAASQRVSLSPGVNEIKFRVQPRTQGEVELAARVRAEGDQAEENDRLSQTAWIGPRPRILYAEGATASAPFLRNALVRQGMAVQVAGAGQLGAELARIESYDAIVLSDLPAAKVNAAAMAKLETYVRDGGGGLVFVAGESTYGEAGFAKSAVERVLPVKFEGEGRRKTVDMVLLIDRSFSMRGQKIEMAKTAAVATAKALDPQHRLAVLAFDSMPEEIVPLAPVGDGKTVEELLSRMESSGQTNIFTALMYAWRLLEKSEAKLKHIVLMSDGDTAPEGLKGLLQDRTPDVSIPAIQMARKQLQKKKKDELAKLITDDKPLPNTFNELVARMADDKITLTTVAVGEQPNMELMGNLANWGSGKSYLAYHAAELPRLYVDETKRVLKSAIIEEAFRPVVKRKTEALEGLDFAKAPQLKGYVTARAKRYAEVLMETPTGAPILAQTQYGLGKTVAFMSDAKNRWAVDWMNWPGYGKFWSQLVRETMRRDSGEELRFRVAREGDEARISLAALSGKGEFRNELAPQVDVTDPDGSTHALSLRQLAPGLYEAKLPLAAAQAKPFAFALRAGGGLAQSELATIGARKLFYPYPDEYRVYPPNVEFLKRLSEHTGGKFAPKVNEIFADLGDGGRVQTALWPYFAAAALVIYLLDVLLRRAGWLAWRDRRAIKAG